MIRLFVGLALPESHHQRLSALSHGVEGARWVADRNLHITLRFIGEVEEHVGEDIIAALHSVQSKPFNVTIKGLGTFGRPPHALWAGVEDAPQGALAELAANVERVLVRLGLEPEHRNFTPHVTLARFRKVHDARLSRYMAQFGDLALEPFTVTGFSVFQSHLRPEGAEYERIVEYVWTPSE
jgi:2'-5' RNA ligase